MFIVLSFRLATLTIVEGDKYRELSDTKRVKEIGITAPRGEIRDRYGRLLAGNKPSFTVQILKDELNIKDKKKKNEIILELIKILEEDGVTYLDELPIKLNTFHYINENNIEIEGSDPEDVIIETIIENNLLGQLLDTYYKGEREGHFLFLTANKAIHALENKGLDIPISVSLNGDSVVYSYDENMNMKKLSGKMKMV